MEQNNSLSGEIIFQDKTVLRKFFGKPRIPRKTKKTLGTLMQKRDGNEYIITITFKAKRTGPFKRFCRYCIKKGVKQGMLPLKNGTIVNLIFNEHQS